MCILRGTLFMRKTRDKSRSVAGLTMMEMVISMAILAVVFAAILPQFANIRNSWDLQEAKAEMIQNGRVLNEHIKRNLSRAVVITAVSDPSDNRGEITFEAPDGLLYRYKLSNGYVAFGQVGNLADLAGPVSTLRFSCYRLDDIATTTTDVDWIRLVQTDVTFLNSASLGQNQSYTTKVYLAANGGSQNNDFVIQSSKYEFDLGTGIDPAVARIDARHHICAYTGEGGDGWSVVLRVDPSAETIAAGTPFEFDTSNGRRPDLAKIDDGHYLCAYSGYKTDGWAVVLTVDLVGYNITAETPFEFDPVDCFQPELARIDAQNFLCVYRDNNSNGLAVILTVDPATWFVTVGTLLNFSTSCGEPALAQVDATNFLCTYHGGSAGRAAVLTVDTGLGTVTCGPILTHSLNGSKASDVVRMDGNNFLCAYTIGANTGFSRVLSVAPVTRQITAKGTAFEFGPGQGKAPAIIRMNSSEALCAWDGVGDEGTIAILEVETLTGQISKRVPYVFDRRGMNSVLGIVTSDIYLGVYQGLDSDGWAVLFNINGGIRP